MSKRKSLTKLLLCDIHPIYTHSKHYWSLSAEMLMVGLWGHSLLSSGGTTSPGHTEPLTQAGSSLLLVNANHLLRTFFLRGVAAPSWKNLCRRCRGAQSSQVCECWPKRFWAALYHSHRRRVCASQRYWKTNSTKSHNFKRTKLQKATRRCSFIVPHIKISEQALKFSKFNYFFKKRMQT